MKSRILSNSLANYAGQFITVGITLLLTPALLFHLGDALYGVLILVSSIQGLGGLFDFGIGTSVVKYVAEHRAREEHDEINRVVSTSLVLYLALGMLALLTVVAVALFGLPLLGLEAELEHTAKYALILAGVSLAISVPMGVFSNLLLGLRHYEVSNAVNVVQVVVTAGVTLFVLELGAGPIELMLVNTVSLALTSIAKMLFAFRLLKGLRVTPRQASRTTLRRITGYSGWVFLLDIARRIFYNADAVLIAAYLPVSKVTAYNLGFKPASALTYLSSPFVSVLLPAASALQAKEDRGQLYRLLVASTRLALLLTLPAALWLALFGPWIIEAWVGPGHEDAVPVLLIFCLVFLVSTAQNPSGVILRGIGKVRALALAVVGEYAANIGLTLLLLPVLGVIGAAVGTLIPGLLLGLLVVPWLACRAIGSSYAGFMANSFVGPLLAAIPTAGVAWLLRDRLYGPPWVVALISGCLVLTLFSLFYLLLGTNNEERLILARWRDGLMGRLRRGQTTR
jgi:O-antigen/teichoic acid export membrane protein